MTPKVKKNILIYVHGFNPGEPMYKSTIVGIAPYFYGRFATGAYLALEKEGRLVVFDSANGEGPMAKLTIENSINELVKFNAFKGLTEKQIRDRLVVEIIQSPFPFKPKNTTQEAEALVEMVKQTGGAAYYEDIYVISSIEHIQRVTKEMLIACFAANEPEIATRMRFVPALTPYTPTTKEELGEDTQTQTKKTLAILRNLVILEPRGALANRDKKVGDFLPKSNSEA
ncbi:MAG: hypothetical protein WC470_01350 [Candidatus Paceibacterota bacterium]